MARQRWNVLCLKFKFEIQKFEGGWCARAVCALVDAAKLGSACCRGCGRGRGGNPLLQKDRLPGQLQLAIRHDLSSQPDSMSPLYIYIMPCLLVVKHFARCSLPQHGLVQCTQQNCTLQNCRQGGDHCLQEADYLMKQMLVNTKGNKSINML